MEANVNSDVQVDSLILKSANMDQLKQRPQIVSEEIKEKASKDQRRVKQRMKQQELAPAQQKAKDN